MPISTPDVRQDWAPESWRGHRFGLPEERWKFIADRAYWVTGAGSGFGQAVSVCLALAGARVFVSGRTSNKLRHTIELAKQFGAADGSVIAVPLDVTDAEQVDEGAAMIGRSCQHLFGLVNNAALPSAGAGDWPLQCSDVETWSRLMATNVTGPWLVTRAALPVMRRGSGLRLLFVTSEAGWAGTAGVGPYNVSKAALNSLTFSMADELSARWPDYDAQVNALIPGEARTEMNQGSTISPFSICTMAMLLLSHGSDGPSGRFFHRDGRHFEFGYAAPWHKSLLQDVDLGS